jgi:hypothetical protein
MPLRQAIAASVSRDLQRAGRGSPFYTNPASGLVTDAAWTKEEYDVTPYKGAGAAFRVRFGYAILSASAYSMSGWNVDDVTVSAGFLPVTRSVRHPGRLRACEAERRRSRLGPKPPYPGDLT